MNEVDASSVIHETINLLKALIRIPSLSGQEKEAADYLQAQLETYFPHCLKRDGHNLMVDLKGSSSGPTLLLCSHIDTVAAAHGWTKNPFGAESEEDRVYGLGANDAGASVVSMIGAARRLGTTFKGRLILCLAAEEEAGNNGFVKVEPSLPRYDAAIFGEPTNMGMATAMRGAMRAVMRSHGVSCHASRPWEGRNACDQFAKDLALLRSIDLKDTSPWGGTTIEPTLLKGGTTVNQIPDLVEATLDIRTTSEKNNEWVIDTLRKTTLDIDITINRRQPMRNDPTSLLVKAVRNGCPKVADYTFNGTCDMAFSKSPSIVMGPGRSERSHAADEFIRVPELHEAVDMYHAILKAYLN